MTKYELAVLYHPDLEVDLSKAEQKVNGIVADSGGKIIKTDAQGKRKLAYTIAKQDWAVYVFYSLELPSDGPQKIENALNITDEILRYLLVKYDPKSEKPKEAAQKSEEKADTPKESKIKGGKKDKE